MADIFLSYKKTDIEKIQPLISLLEQGGWSVWWDTRIGAGERWDDTIERELLAAKCVVVVWSPDSISSQWVRTEASEAMERGKLVPVTIEGAFSPLAFKLIQVTDFSNWNGGRDEAPARALLSAVQRFTGPPAAPAPVDREAVERATAIAQMKAEESHWQAIANTQDAAALRKFLEKYPQGTYHAAAEAQLARRHEPRPQSGRRAIAMGVGGVGLVAALAAAALSLGWTRSTPPPPAEQKATAAPAVATPAPQIVVKNAPPPNECDRLAAYPNDETAAAIQVPFEAMDGPRARIACEDAVKKHPAEPRFKLQLARSLFRIGDGAGAVALINELVATNFVPAYLILASHYTTGKAVAKDYKKALELYQKAFDAGSASALDSIGHIYERGLGVAKDVEKAKALYEESSAKGSRRGTYYLGRLYAEGIGVEKDPEKALRLLEEASNKGEPLASASIGLLYKNGTGVAQDYGKARAYFEKSIEQGGIDGILNLGLLHLKGLGVPPNPTRARELFESAANKGSTWAMTTLAYMYRTGDGVPENVEQAKSLYERAIAEGDTGSNFSLGVMAREGMLSDAGPEAAAEYFRKAADAGHADAMTSLGNLYAEGNGVEQSETEAFKWHKKSAEAGSAAGMNNLALAYRDGTGTEADSQAAYEWHKKGAEAGDTNAMLSYAEALVGGNLESDAPNDPERAALWVVKAIAAGSRNALGTMLGLPAPPPDAGGILIAGGLGEPFYGSKFRIELQRLMKEKGVYSGALDGVFGPGTQASMRALAETGANKN